MRKLYYLVILLTQISVMGFAQHAATPKEAFDGYKSAILSQQGDVAASYVTQDTIAQYQSYVDWALYAERTELENLSFMNRCQVILMKHRIPASILKEMDGRALFSYAVDHDWIGKSGVISTTTGNFQEASGRAVSDAYSSGQKIPLRFHYRLEDDGWKFDLLSMMQFVGEPMRQMANQSGMSENEFIFRMAESISGRRVPESIWYPIIE